VSGVRALVLLGCVLVACSCGAAREESLQRAGHPAPPIEAIDEPAADLVRSWAERFVPEMRPVEGAEPRAIAQLDLDSESGSKAVPLVAWRSGAGSLCLAIETKNRWGEGAFVVGCEPDLPACGDLCLERSAYGHGADIKYVVFGAVAASADELRVIYDNGETVRFPLVGPLVPGSPSSRVFMFELGRRLYRRLELLAGGEVTTSVSISRPDLEWERCLMETEGYGRPPTDDVFDKCADRAEALGPFGS
jgi:hypothetical protein